MSDVNAVIVQPFKQFVKVRRAASKTSIAGTHHANAPSPRAPSSRARYSARAPSCGSAPSAVVAAATERPSAVGPAASRDASRHNTHAAVAPSPAPRHRHIPHAGLHSLGQEVYEAGPQGICADRVGDDDRLPDHGCVAPRQKRALLGRARRPFPSPGAQARRACARIVLSCRHGRA